jgi:predicted ATPase
MNRAEEQKAHRHRVEQSLLDIKGDILLTKMDIAQMKVDLAHHIKRSDKHEKWLMVMIVGAAMTAGAGLKYVLPLVMKII